jgi:hypothetical protein
MPRRRLIPLVLALVLVSACARSEKVNDGKVSAARSGASGGGDGHAEPDPRPVEDCSADC